MSLQTRLSALITAVGTDIKELKARTPTILANLTSLNDTKQPSNAVEWRDDSDDSLTGKFVTINPIVSAVIVDRSELWVRVKSRTGGASSDKKLLDSDGVSDFALLSNVLRNPTGFVDLTGSSAWNSPRQPNTTRSTLVHLTLGGSGNTQHSVYVGPANPPTQRILIGGSGANTNAWVPYTFIVPPGYYYRYTQDVSTPGIGTRIEWTL